MSAANTLILGGRLTKDPEDIKTKTGKRMVKFTLAVKKSKDKAFFIPCIAWEKVAETIIGYVKKGYYVIASGELHYENSKSENDEWKTICYCNVHNVDIVNWGKEGNIADSAQKTFNAKPVSDVDDFDAADMPF